MEENKNTKHVIHRIFKEEDYDGRINQSHGRK